MSELGRGAPVRRQRSTTKYCDWYGRRGCPTKGHGQRRGCKGCRCTTQPGVGHTHHEASEGGGELSRGRFVGISQEKCIFTWFDNMYEHSYVPASQLAVTHVSGHGRRPRPLKGRLIWDSGYTIVNRVKGFDRMSTTRMK